VRGLTPFFSARSDWDDLGKLPKSFLSPCFVDLFFCLQRGLVGMGLDPCPSCLRITRAEQLRRIGGHVMVCLFDLVPFGEGDTILPCEFHRGCVFEEKAGRKETVRDLGESEVTFALFRCPLRSHPGGLAEGYLGVAPNTAVRYRPQSTPGGQSALL
jgi:hypothetical protein